MCSRVGRDKSQSELGEPLGLSSGLFKTNFVGRLEREMIKDQIMINLAI